MHEKLQSPNQSPEVIHGSEVQIDMAGDVYSPDKIGLITEDENYIYGVASELGLPSISEEGELSFGLEQGTAIGIIRAFNKQNRAEIFLVGLKSDEDGRKVVAGEWMPVPTDTALTIGRRSSEADEPGKITGEHLFGKDFSTAVSRKQLEITLSSEGILTVRDQSANGTAYHEQPSAATEASQSRTENNKDEFEKIQGGIQLLTENLSDKDKLALWKYASGILNKNEALQREQHQEAKNQDNLAGEGWREMSQGARDVAEEYKTFMAELSRTNAK